MEGLISQFTFLSDQSLTDKTFDPSVIDDDLMKLFEIESYNAWAAMELQHAAQFTSAQSAIDDAERYLDDVMESAMEEFRVFEEEMERELSKEERSLVAVAEKARRLGDRAEKTASFAANKYVEGVVTLAGASMKSAVRAIAVNSKNKVHPS